MLSEGVDEGDEGGAVEGVCGPEGDGLLGPGGVGVGICVDELEQLDATSTTPITAAIDIRSRNLTFMTPTPVRSG